MRHSGLLGLVLVLLASSCSSQTVDTTSEASGPAPSTTSDAVTSTSIPDATSGLSGTPTPAARDLGGALLILPPVDPGVLVSSRLIERDEARETWVSPDQSSDGIEVSLDACRIRYPGQWAFDLTMAVPDWATPPITLGLDFSWGLGDVWTGLPPIEVELAGPGSFTVAFDSFTYIAEQVTPLDAEQRERPSGGLSDRFRHSDSMEWVGAGCSVDIDHSPQAPVADRTISGVKVVADPTAPEVTAVEGTLQHLAQTADLVDVADIGRPWAQLYGYGWAPVVEVVWLDPERPVTSVSEDWTFGGRCYTLRTGYGHDDQPSFGVWQYQGCRADGPRESQPSAMREVGSWTILVSGDDQAVVDAAIGRLVPYFNTTPWPPPDPRGTTIGEIDVEGATVYLVRVEYDGGSEQILLESSDLELSGPFEGANHETWRGCWQTTVYHPDLALILVGDPTWEVRVDDNLLFMFDVDGIGAALIPWSSGSPPHPTITFPEGTTPCS